jgi:hypothetical protein
LPEFMFLLTSSDMGIASAQGIRRQPKETVSTVRLAKDLHSTKVSYSTFWVKVGIRLMFQERGVRDRISSMPDVHGP